MKTLKFLIPLLLLHLLILINLRFTAWPEMLSYPYLISKGFDLYKDIAMPYQPLLPLFQSVYFSIFGYSLDALKILTWGVIIFCDVLIYLISRKVLGGKFISILPLTIYIVLQPLMDGNGLWFDLTLTPFILLAIFCYLHDKKRLFFVSFFIMIASLIKQQTALVFIPLTLFIIFDLKNKKLKDLIWYFTGAVIPILLVTIYISSKGIWIDYIFWTFTVPIFWYPKFSNYLYFPTWIDLIKLLLIFGPLLIVLTNIKKARIFFVLLSIFLPLLLTSFTRFEYLRLQQALAVYIVLLIFIIRDYQKYLPILLTSIIFGILSLVSINLGNTGQGRFYEDKDLSLAHQIKSVSGNETIYLINLPSVIYPMAQLTPTKPWIDNYVWYFEIEGQQEKFIEGLSKNPPKYIFRKVPDIGGWDALGVYEPQKVILYMKEYYKPDGMIRDNIEVWIKN